MEVAPHLTRSYTSSSTATTHNRLHNSNGSSFTANNSSSHPGSQYSSYSHSYRTSDDTTASTLFSNPSPAIPNSLSGAVTASNNVINKVADKESSLFQSCLTLRNRLRAVPDFEDQLQEVEEASNDMNTVDPVTLLWRTFRRGYPLLTIYNALQPKISLEFDETKYSGMTGKQEKAAAYKFLKACLEELKFPDSECFFITDLYGDDTTGFVKVTRVVNRVVDILVRDGKIEDYECETDLGATTGRKRTQRQHIVDELLVEQRGLVPGDAIHDIFLNLNALLDFQRRFLIRVEQINAEPEDQQQWGELFKMYAAAFRVYEPYIANQKRCETTAMREFERLRATGGSEEMRQMVESEGTLTGFLMKPFQRLSKYPLLLKSLRDKGDLDEVKQQALSEGIEGVQAVLNRVNEFVAKEERLEVVADLKKQIEDWRNHRVEAFGQLLLHGTFSVTKGDGQNTEREYKIYLFEKILLCCKEVKENKQKSKIMNKHPSGLKGKPKLQLKGRIFMQNVIDCIFLAKPGSYSGQINWRADDTVEYFIIRFPTEDVMRVWQQQIEQQKLICVEKFQGENGGERSTSQTQFNYILDQGPLENPWKETDFGEEDDYEDGDYSYPKSRNGSSNSLRSRSTNGVMPPGLRTNGLAGPAVASPGERGGNSYFSPTAESPGSIRTSGSSGFFNFPRPGGANGGWDEGAGNSRFTAPAGGGYHDRARGIPSGSHASAPQSLMDKRLRSFSSPDIQGNNTRRGMSNAPPVPSVPSHLAQSASHVNRSQSNSPIQNGVPSRAQAHSPLSGLQHGEYDGGNSSNSHETSSNFVSMSPDDLPPPSQIKVKVKVPSDNYTTTLVVGFNITYQSLRDRIDAKLQRVTRLSLASGSTTLKYVYEDILASIQNDEDVQTAFENWREEQRDYVNAGQLGEIELICMKN